MTTVKAGATVEQPVRARFGAWPHEHDVVQLVLLDHHMVPTVADVEAWISQARLPSPRPDRQVTPRAIRTGALFPAAAEPFLTAGFTAIDSLALLEAPLSAPPRRHTNGAERAGRVSTRRMRRGDHAAVAALDRLAFGDPWGNDERSLREVTTATPHHRARLARASARSGGRLDGFAISGQSGAFGYLQRLAVRDDVRRQGVARALVDDATEWMRRRGATSVMVNTAIGNVAALALYERLGFRRRDEMLSILEFTLR